MKAHRNQKGFAVVEVLVVAVVLALVGFVIFKAVTAKRNIQPTQTQTEEPAREEEADPTADWKVYTTAKGKFELKHPREWYPDTCPNDSASFSLYLGTTRKSRVICATEQGSQIFAFSVSGDSRAEYKLAGNYDDQTSKSVTADGVKGIRESGEVSVQEEGPGSLPVGTSIVRYVFYDGSRTYLISYYRTPTGDYSGDFLEEFDLMVTKTLKFQ